MAAPVYKVDAYFDLPATGGSNIFTLDDPVKGVLDSAYVLAGDIATDISQYVVSITTNRGVSRRFDQVRAGTCTIELKNQFREFDQLYASSPYFGNILPGKRITVKASGVTIFDGQVESWKYRYGRNRMPIAVVTVVDALAVLAQKQLSAWTTSAGQLAGARLVSLLDRPEVLFGAGRSIDAGVFTLQGDVVAENTNALVYAQKVARSDFGRFYASRDNVETFRDRRANLNVGPQVTFINDGSGTKFVDVERSSADEYLWNYVVAGRRGGSTQIFTNQASIDQYGIRALPDDVGLADLIVETDAQAYDYGLYMATAYSAAEDRFSSITIQLHGLTGAQQALVSALDISSLVRVVWAPGDVGAAIDRTCIVEGVNHTAQRNSHVLKIAVGDAINRVPFILDDPVYGVLDGPGVLIF